MSPKATDIYAAFKNYPFQTEAHRQLAKARASVCGVCPFANYKSSTVVNNNTIHLYNCSQCKCGLFGKIRQKNANCPLGKWGNND